MNDSQCEYCSAANCLACKGNYSLDYLVTKKCMQQCADGYYSVIKVLTQYSNYSYSVCEKCSVQCATCVNLNNNCTSCKWVDNLTTSQYYKLDNSCYLSQNCPITYYADSTTKTCADCSKSIQGCINCQSFNNCTLCDTTNGYYNFTSINVDNNITTSLCLKSN